MVALAVRGISAAVCWAAGAAAIGAVAGYTAKSYVGVGDDKADGKESTDTSGKRTPEANPKE